MREFLPTARGLVIQTLFLMAILAAHEMLRGPFAGLHVLTVPVLAIPVAYYSSVLGIRGAIMAAALSALIIVDHVHDRHPIILALEVAQVGAISLFGAIVAARTNSERPLDDEVSGQAQQRFDQLAGEPGYWDRVGITKMGLYVTRVESEFIARSLDERPRGYTADIGAGSGRLHPAMIPRSRALLGTEITRDQLEIMSKDGSVAAILVQQGQPSLPFRSQSLNTVVAIEVPAVSDQAWFRAECGRVLASNGRVIITAHNALSYKGLVSRLLGRWRASRGKSWANLYYRYGLSVHIREWKKAGFEIRASTGFYWPPLPRDADGAWVQIAAILERIMGLRLVTAWSPWVLLELEKR